MKKRVSKMSFSCTWDEYVQSFAWTADLKGLVASLFSALSASGVECGFFVGFFF